MHPDNTITFHTIVVYTMGDKLTGESDWFSNGVPLRSIPPFNTKHDLSFRRMLSSATSLYIGTDFRYYAQQKRIAPSADGGFITPFYFLTGASCGCSYRTRDNKLDFRIRIDNLTNNYYFPFESLIPGMERNFKILLSMNI